MPCGPGGAICGPRSFSKIGRRAESELAHLTDRPTLHHPAVSQPALPASSQPSKRPRLRSVSSTPIHNSHLHPFLSSQSSRAHPSFAALKDSRTFRSGARDRSVPFPPPPVAHPAALSLSLSWYLAQARRQTTPSRRRTPRRHPSYPAWRASLPLQRRRPSSTPFLGLAQRQARADRRQNEVRVSTLQQAPDAGREQHADSDQNTSRAQLER